MAAVTPVPGQPGVYQDADGEAFTIKNARDDDVMDTVQIAAGLVTANQEHVFFQNLDNKREIDTTLKSPRKLADGERLLLHSVGVRIRERTGNVRVSVDTIKAIADCALLSFSLNETVLARGPVYKYGTGYGLSGMTNEADVGVASVGIPSTAARAFMIQKHLITHRHNLDGKLIFQDRAWIPTGDNAIVAGGVNGAGAGIGVNAAAGTAWNQAGAERLPTISEAVLVSLMLYGLRSAPATP